VLAAGTRHPTDPEAFEAAAAFARVVGISLPAMPRAAARAGCCAVSGGGRGLTRS
jgi:hypothetical protein